MPPRWRLSGQRRGGVFRGSVAREAAEGRLQVTDPLKDRGWQSGSEEKGWNGNERVGGAVGKRVPLKEGMAGLLGNRCFGL